MIATKLFNKKTSTHVVFKKNPLLERNLTIIILLISFKSIEQFFVFKLPSFDFFEIPIFLLIIFHLFTLKNKYFNPRDKQASFWLNIFATYVSISSIVGLFFCCKNYLDYKGLIQMSTYLLVCIIAYIATNAYFCQTFLRLYFKFCFPFFPLIFLLIQHEAFGFFLAPIILILLFSSFLDNRWKLIILILTFFIIFISFFLSARSLFLKFSLSLILGFLIFFKYIFTKRFLNIIRIILLLSPFFFLSLAVLKVFNIFNPVKDDSSKYSVKGTNNNGEEEETSLVVDTRTFMYVEAFNTLTTYNCWVFGRSPARGTISSALGDAVETNRGERIENEANIVNITVWLGLIGFILYFLIFFSASYFAINKSNNYFMKIIGVLISFNYAYSWVENAAGFDLQYFIIWIMIGIAFSKEFRMMTDKELKIWVLGIFYKKLSIV